MLYLVKFTVLSNGQVHNRDAFTDIVFKKAVTTFLMEKLTEMYVKFHHEKYHN